MPYLSCSNRVAIHKNDRTFTVCCKIRDQIIGLRQLSESQSQKMTIPDDSVNMDVIALATDKRLASIQLFQMRAGKLVGRLGFTADAIDREDKLILQMVIEEHYSQIDPIEIPKKILLQYPISQQSLISSWLSELKGSKVILSCPQRHTKAKLVELVILTLNILFNIFSFELIKVL